MSGALAPPGSSTYDSDTMHVGDGTWDSQRDTFLLPNLVGLNFDTMRYNGMGNRFQELHQYHNLIRGHGIVAAITFLGIVPAAILIARFYGRNPYWRVRLHIWLQVLTLLLTTVVFVLGWMAVGPERSLSNPHHGIGLAIYVLVIYQVLNGWWVHKREKNKGHRHIPLKLMLHQWLGRAIALLGIVQIPLGLTLYGSPVSLFVLYTLAAFALLFIYFILTYLHQRRMGQYYEGGGSYVSGTEVIDDRHRSHSRLGKIAAAGAAGVGLAALGNRLRHRSQSRSRVDAVGSDSYTGSSYIDEKVSDRERSGWSRRLLEIGAIGGAVALAKRWFDRRRGRDEESGISSSYRPPYGGNASVAQDSASRINDSRPGPILGGVGAPVGIGNPPPMPAHRRSYSSISSTSYMSESRQGHGIRNTLAGVGAFAALRSMFKNRREKKEQRRVEELRQQDIEQERIARANSGRRYTGDGFRPGRAQSMTSTDLSESAVGSRHGVNPAAPLATGAADSAPLPQYDRDRVHATNPLTGQPPIANVPPIPAAHMDSSGSDVYTSAGGGHHRHHHPIRGATAGGLAAAEIGEGSSRRRRSSGRQDDYAESPPVSVKVRMHGDGRHVTLRRLTEQEAAASRETKRREREQRRRSGSRRRRAGSVSSLSGTDNGNDRWRRNEAIERRQAEQIRRQNEAAAAQHVEGAAGPSTVSSLPPPPPIPGQPTGSLTSPGEITGTEASADYASNRRRRRAERAQARLAREQRGGQSVEFT